MNSHTTFTEKKDVDCEQSRSDLVRRVNETRRKRAAAWEEKKSSLNENKQVQAIRTAMITSTKTQQKAFLCRQKKSKTCFFFFFSNKLQSLSWKLIVSSSNTPRRVLRDEINLVISAFEPESRWAHNYWLA